MVDKLTRQEKIDKLVRSEENYLSGQISEYRHMLERKTDAEIDVEYKREYD